MWSHRAESERERRGAAALTGGHAARYERAAVLMDNSRIEPGALEREGRTLGATINRMPLLHSTRNAQRKCARPRLSYSPTNEVAVQYPEPIVPPGLGGAGPTRVRARLRRARLRRRRRLLLRRLALLPPGRGLLRSSRPSRPRSLTIRSLRWAPRGTIPSRAASFRTPTTLARRASVYADAHRGIFRKPLWHEAASCPRAIMTATS